MSKNVKKLLSVLVAFVLVLALVPMEAHAEKMKPEDYKVESEFHLGGSGKLSYVTGTVKLDKTITSPQPQPVEGSQGLYAGSVSAKVEAADLFAGAYQFYVDKIQNSSTGGKDWKNIVMYDEGEKFPTARYTVTFPDNFTIDYENISLSENTGTISSVSKKLSEDGHSVTLIFNLGNWNDYAGFFDLVAKEIGEAGHLIDISIPYTATDPGNGSNSLGTIKGSGQCKLYKYGRFSLKRPIVDIASPEIQMDISK